MNTYLSISEYARQASILNVSLTSEALQRTKAAAVDEVLTDEVSPALRRIPIEWPDSQGDSARRGS